MKISIMKIQTGKGKKSIRENTSSSFVEKVRKEEGFSLVEVIFALVILLIALLGVFVTITYSINYNAGNSSRSQALALLQREIETMRSKKFTPDYTDPDLYGHDRTVRNETASNGNVFTVAVTIDNDPSTLNVIETDETVNPPIKQITITVTLANPTPGWQTAVPATVILQRVRGN